MPNRWLKLIRIVFFFSFALSIKFWPLLLMKQILSEWGHCHLMPGKLVK